MVEVAAAIAGAAISATFLGVNSHNRRTAEGRDCLIRLSTSVDNVASRLEELHDDLRSERVEIFARLSAAEQKIARLEGQVKYP